MQYFKVWKALAIKLIGDVFLSALGLRGERCDKKVNGITF